MQMIRFRLALLAVLALTGAGINGRVTLAAAADSLYVGDGNDASVKRFDADTGASQGDLVKGSTA